MDEENKPEIKKEEKENILIKSLRTYQGDIEEAVSKKGYSKASIFLAEQEKKDSELMEFEKEEDTKARNKFFILIGSILFILGSLTIGAMFYIKSKEEIVIIQKTKALISFSQEKSLEATSREEINNNILAEKKSFQLPVNSVLYLNLVDKQKNPEKLENILTIIAPQMDSALIRSFDKEYMFGIYSFDTNEPFIILTIKDFGSSFSGMLKWEKGIISDFGKLFSINTDETYQFKDETIKNKDMRILKNKENKTILLYSFVDRETLIITTNENILNAIINKYNISKQTK